VKTQLLRPLSLLVLPAALVISCQGSPPTTQQIAVNNLTQGAVQLKLRKGETTQTEVLESFGAPNITTLDSDGREVWTYRRHATVTAEGTSNSYFNIVVFGASSGSGTASTTSQTTTLIIKFSADKKVSEFRSLTSSF